MTCAGGIRCQCGGDGYVERGPAGATFSYPCYPWDCSVPDCGCKADKSPSSKQAFEARFWALAVEDPRAFADCVADFLDGLAKQGQS